jgi:hypothetical protein
MLLYTQKVVIGPGISIQASIFKKIKANKVGLYVASLMGATLSREHMSTHSYKGQKENNGIVKPKLDVEYTSTLISKCRSVS